MPSNDVKNEVSSAGHHLATSRFSTQTWQYSAESETPAGYVPCNAEQSGNFPPHDAMGEWRTTHPLAAQQYDSLSALVTSWDPPPVSLESAPSLGRYCIRGMEHCEIDIGTNASACTATAASSLIEHLAVDFTGIGAGEAITGGCLGGIGVADHG